VNGSIDAQEDRESTAVQQIPGSTPRTQAGAISVPKAVRFWTGAANAKSNRRRYSKEIEAASR
jgi:hypothetical protein